MRIHIFIFCARQKKRSNNCVSMRMLSVVRVYLLVFFVFIAKRKMELMMVAVKAIQIHFDRLLPRLRQQF